MIAADVYKGVRMFVRNHDHKFENVFVHSWEADSFSVTSTGYVYEIEVKISRSDFFADFKKPKHHFFKSYKSGMGIMPMGEGRNWEGWPLTDQFPELRNFQINYNNIQAQPFNYKTSPNRFFYACPVGLLEAHEIPEYAGLLYVMDTFREPRVIKKAPLLHKDPINIKEMLFNKYYYLSINQKEEIRNLQWKVNDLTEKLNKEIA